MFADDMIEFLENQKDCTENTMKIRHESGNRAGLEGKLKNLIAF